MRQAAPEVTRQAATGDSCQADASVFDFIQVQDMAPMSKDLMSDTLDSFAPRLPVVELAAAPSVSHVSEAQALAADVVPAESAPPSRVEARWLGPCNVDGATLELGFRAAVSSETGPGTMPSSLGSSTQMAEDPGYTLFCSALP
jgi:hypothetical protein